MFGLAHFDTMPIIYGVIMFLGIWSMWRKLMTGRIIPLMIEVGVFSFVFWLHGGTMAGGFAAMTCALLAGFFLPKTLSRSK